jgi:hypothetical protein
MTVRISYIKWGINPDGVTYASDYAQVWKNFVESDEQYLYSNDILDREYNARIIHNDIVFATEEDAVRFILRWS